jgi:reactive intermediate/imine deaminase
MRNDLGMAGALDMDVSTIDPVGKVIKITTAGAPQPLGHYVQATVHNGIAYISGQLPVRPDGTHAVHASFDEQTTQALANLLAVVQAAKGSRHSILKLTAYIVGAENWLSFNRVCGEMLEGAKPARSVVPVPGLHFGYLVELDAVAVCHASGEPGA